MLAVALLFAMPIASRLVASAAGDAHGTWAQLCTASGMKLVKIGFPPVASDGELPSAPAMDPMHDDCPYCPLSAGMVVLLCLLLALHATPRRNAWTRRFDVARAFLHPTGLGSRGPPLPA
ncbi:DUF2946 family protein [Xanthomonas sp.]|uniref:DUF2946 family protein n=1 Tax=Xanthomonas sp. TaxID=29446 RepID=UPI001F130155|nr:DUF2946 family protein [Xanthomonas sp.]